MRFEQLNLNDRGNVPVGTEYHTMVQHAYQPQPYHLQESIPL